MIVYTSITNNKDGLKVNQKYDGAKFVAFMDTIPDNIGQWEVKKAYDKFKDPNRNAKIHKVLSHLYLPKFHDVSIWMDGNLMFVGSVQEFVDIHLPKDKDIMFFKHGGRSCIYDEAQACTVAKRDNIQDIKSQITYYRSLSYPAHKYLCNCSIIIRRNTKAVEDFNNRWWAEVCRFSKRDQISCPISLDSAPIAYHIASHTCTQKYIIGFPHKC